MILLDIGNRIILETFQKLLEADKKERPTVEVICADFDGVQFHISNPDAARKNIVTLSVQWRCIPSLFQHGAAEDLKSYYGSYLLPKPENGYDVTLQIDLDAVSEADKATLPDRLSFIKRHLLAAPFRKTFQAIEAGKQGGLIEIAYREDEAIYIKPESGQVTVIFFITFKDPSDQILAKVFLQEFANAKMSLKNAPAVSFTSRREAPLELKGLVKEDPRASSEPVKGFEGGFVSFVLFPNHLKKPEPTINTIISFRNYLQYHIKCSKAHLHTRMRQRVDSLLQVLNRARPEPFEKKEKKKFDGRSLDKPAAPAPTKATPPAKATPKGFK
jgi:actin related protein 2/3 complex subunit 2